jgi:hypothetical protein
MRYLAYVVLPLLSVTPHASPANTKNVRVLRARTNYGICTFYCTQPGALAGCAESCKDTYQADLRACRAAR